MPTSQGGELLTQHVGDHESGTHRLGIAVQLHTRHASPSHLDARNALVHSEDPAVALDAIDQNLVELPLTATERHEPSGPRTVESSGSEGRWKSPQVGSKAHRLGDDVSVRVVARKLGEQIGVGLGPRVGQGGSDPSRLAPFHEGARRPDRVALEGPVGGCGDPSEVAVQLAHQPPCFGKLTFDLTTEMRGIRRDIEPTPRQEQLERRRHLLDPPAPGLGLG